MLEIKHKSDIVEYKNFLTREESEKLISFLESSPNDWQITCFYNARVMFPYDPLKTDVTNHFTEKEIDALKSKFSDAAAKVFDRDLVVRGFSASKWMTGAFADYHADNAELDGTPNEWQDNKLVTIIYLNDDYEGGDLVFRDHDLRISPEAGTLVVFDVGINNVHGVTEVTSGTRYTILTSFDYAESDYPQEYWEKKAAELKAAEQERIIQKSIWDEQGIPSDAPLRLED